MIALRAPYPWFGGKRRIAPFVWRRFGDVRNYVEPFFGSGAVLLARPWPFDGTETINDLDCFVANFWRALQADPSGVADRADWPVSEADLHARHVWLVNEGRHHVEKLKSDPDYFDVKIAGWWVWGLCQWIGTGWCSHPEKRQRPHLSGAGMGVHRPSQKSPHLDGTGLGIHRPSHQIPHSDGGRRGYLREYLAALAQRLRGVRVCCGDWSRICGESPTIYNGLTAVFLDPPYLQTERYADIYAIEANVSAAVRAWCLERGGVKLLRIALCGYAGEGHEELEAHGWRAEAWKAMGGYGLQCDGEGRENRRRERIWFSPHCLYHKGLFE